MPPLVVSAAAEGGHAGTAALTVDQHIEPLVGAQLPEIFRQVPGLSVQESFGGFDPPRLAVRGSGIQSAPSSRGLAISWQGMPMNAADGSFNLALLDSSWIEQATLVRGPAAGVPALGGMLALAADPFVTGSRAAATLGSDDMIGLAAQWAGEHGSHKLAGRAAWLRSDGWRPHSEQERGMAYAATRHALGPETELALQFLATNPSLEVPGPLSKQDALENPQSITPLVRQDRPLRETEYAQAAARLSTRAAGTRASLAIGGVSFSDDFRQLTANGVSETDANEAWLAADAVMDWSGTPHQTRISTLLQSGWWDARRFRNYAGSTGALIGDQDLRPLTWQAALDHRWQVAAQHRFEVGASVLGARREIRDHLPPQPGIGPLDLTFSGTRLAPRAAWVWSPLAGTEITAAWARSYEPPTFGDLLFTDGPLDARVLRSKQLDWQRADSFEVGARGRQGTLSWTSALYLAPWRDELLRLVDENGAPRGTVNAGRTIHRGWENSLEWEFLRQSGGSLALWATYNLTDASFDDDPVYGSRHVAGVPPHSGAVELRATSESGWFVAPGLQWQAGETYGDHYNTIGYGGYALCSLEIGRRHPDGWSLSLRIHNLLDRATIASTAGVLERAPDPRNAAIFLPASPRGVELTFQCAW